jgi:crotonobetainyl-CoA:carnitine CoA-transferase CaiB-like acyl-CoA transferase
MRLPLPHPKAGQVDLVGNPIRIDGQRLAAETPPPALGEHSEEVLSQLLGLDEETLAGLRERGVIGGSGS